MTLEYETTTTGASAAVEAELAHPDKASLALALNGVAMQNEGTATWLGGKNYVTANAEYGTTKLLYVVEVDKTNGSLGSLTVASADGTKTGDTKITISQARKAGTSYVYKTQSGTISTPALDDVLDWTPWDGTSDITATHGHKIGIAEVLSNGMVKSFGQATVDSNGA